jgi:hypothetical protein
MFSPVSFMVLVSFYLFFSLYGFFRERVDLIPPLFCGNHVAVTDDGHASDVSQSQGD